MPQRLAQKMLTIINIDFSHFGLKDEAVLNQPFFDVFGLTHLADSNRISVVGNGALPSIYDVTGFATAAIASLAVAAANLSRLHGANTSTQAITVDRRLASLWMATSIAPIGWALPSPWDDLAGDYRIKDGWVRLHTNAKAHRNAALRVLACQATKEAVAHAFSECSGDELEQTIHAAGGVAGVMRSAQQWLDHPQGKAVAHEPLVHSLDSDVAARATSKTNGTPHRPLAGVRVLDLTKVLAGPVATRALAMLGADVIRVDAADWAEPSVSQDTTIGKRCVHIDGRSVDGRNQLQQLLRSADMFVHGYRPGALDALGLGAELRRDMNPGIVEVSLNAYGHTGPWQHRRGFDSVVQMSCGIAEAGMVQLNRDCPTPLPVQALDHVTGYLMAAVAINAWARKLETSCGSTHRTSLARTAVALMAGPTGDPSAAIEPARLPADDPARSDYGPDIEATSWGQARRLFPPCSIPGIDLRWDRPASELGSSPLPIDWQ
jgi:hypothetical protein